MKKRIFLFLILTALFLKGEAQINIQWATRYTSSGNNVDRAEDIAIDAGGNVYVTGIGLGASGNFDYITIKYNSVGAQQWKAEYNGPGNGLDDAHAIVLDAAGNVYVTGWSDGGATTGFDYATVKYNSSGAQQWATRYNNTTNGTDEAWDIGVDNAGNVYVTGTSDGAGSNSAATSVKYNSTGVQQYAKRFDGAGGGIDAGYAIYVAPVSGDFYIAGYTYQSTSADFDFITIKYNTAGTQQWATKYNGPDNNYDEARSIAVDAAGNVYVAGYTQTAVLTNYDYATVKYNSAGVAQWANLYNGTGNDYDRANAIKLDAVGNVYVTGKSVGTGAAAEDVLTIKYANNGTQKWTARYNGLSSGYDEGKALTIDNSGNIYVTGYSYSSTSNHDYTIIKYDSTGSGSNGVQQWLAKYNGSGNSVDQSAAIAVDNIGNIFITGLSKGSGTNEDYETIKYCQFTAVAVSAKDTICKGANTTLNASGTNAVSYAWTPNNGTLSSVTSATPVATPTVTTSYVVTITNNLGCTDMDTVVVEVLPLPSPTITSNHPTGVCVGDSIQLTAAAGFTYQWNTSSTKQSINVFSSGTYTVTITNAGGCKATGSTTATVYPYPTINAGLDDSVCLSKNIQLQASGGLTYSWSPSSSLSNPSISNPVAGPVTTTTYTVVGTGAGGCTSSDVVKITVLNNPSVPTIYRGTDTLYCNQVAPNYQWYKDGSPISGANNQFYVFTQNGLYNVEVYNALGCTTASTTINITDASVAEIDGLKLLNIYPNPASNHVTLEMNITKASNVKINLTNIAGQIIFTDELSQFSGPYKKQIDLRESAQGIYHLQIITNDQVINTKVVKQ